MKAYKPTSCWLRKDSYMHFISYQFYRGATLNINRMF